jgi:predicted nucleic-acid-binding protein
MKELVLDTNFLISFVTDRNLAQQKKASEVFQTASHLKTKLLCPQSVIIEFVYVLEKIYQQPKQNIKAMVTDLLALPALEVMQSIDFPVVLSMWPEIIGDFGDALVAAAAKVRKGAQVATFDNKLIKAVQKAGIKIMDDKNS